MEDFNSISESLFNTEHNTHFGKSRFLEFLLNKDNSAENSLATLSQRFNGLQILSNFKENESHSSISMTRHSDVDLKSDPVANFNKYIAKFPPSNLQQPAHSKESVSGVIVNGNSFLEFNALPSPTTLNQKKRVLQQPSKSYATVINQRSDELFAPTIRIPPNKGDENTSRYLSGKSVPEKFVQPISSPSWKDMSVGEVALKSFEADGRLASRLRSEAKASVQMTNFVLNKKPPMRANFPWSYGKIMNSQKNYKANKMGHCYWNTQIIPQEGKAVKKCNASSMPIVKKKQPSFIGLQYKVVNNAVPKFKECVFCKTNGETPVMYQSHTLKDETGRTVCPILQRYVCNVCFATGPSAHTLKYCPQNKNPPPIAIMKTLKAMRSSTGRRPRIPYNGFKSVSMRCQ